MSRADDEPITLYPSRRRPIALAVLGLLAIALGAWLLWGEASFGGTAAIVAGAVVLVGAIVWLIPSRAYLHLTDRGFIYCSTFRPRRVDWADVARFGVVQESGVDRVAWDYAPHYPADVDPRRQARARTGFEALLPLGCCRMPAGPLAELLDRRRQRARG